MPTAHHGAEAPRAAEHHIGLARTVAAVVAVGRADDHVGEAVAVHVASRRDAPACLIVRPVAPDHEALRRSQRRQVQYLSPADCGAEAAGGAEHHPGLAGIGACATIGEEMAACGRAHDQVGEAVAIYVASRRDAQARLVKVEVALDDEALRRGQRRQVQHLPPGRVRRAEATRAAEHHIGLAGNFAAVVTAGRADDQVGEAVAVHIASRRDAPARPVPPRIALDD